MPVPSSIADLSTTPASNSPAGSETPSSTDDYLRTLSAFIKQVAEGANLWCGTAGGAANAIVLTPASGISAYVAGQVLRFKAASTNTGATTIAISGLTAIAAQVNGAACVGGEIVANQWYEAWLSSPTAVQIRACDAPNLVGATNFKRASVAATATTTPLWSTVSGNIQDWTSAPTVTDFPAAPQAGAQREVYPAAGTVITNAGNIAVQGNANYTVSAGDRLTITAVTATTFYVSITPKAGAASKIQSIGASVASNALTLTLNPTALDFRSPTLGSGSVNTRTVSSAISLVISSGSTLGTVNAIQSRIVLLAIDNAGTVELAAVNIAGGTNLDETGLISTTAEGGAGAADSANVIYSTTARANVPYRIVGYVESTQAVAGTWATAPSTIQGAGGQALAAMSSLGYGQTFQDMTASRANNTNYTNTTGKPIWVSVRWYRGANTAAYITIIATVAGVIIISKRQFFNTVDNSIECEFIVPPGATYNVNQAGLPSAMTWVELR